MKLPKTPFIISGVALLALIYASRRASKEQLTGQIGGGPMWGSKKMPLPGNPFVTKDLTLGDTWKYQSEAFGVWGYDKATELSPGNVETSGRQGAEFSILTTPGVVIGPMGRYGPMLYEGYFVKDGIRVHQFLVVENARGGLVDVPISNVLTNEVGILHVKLV